MQGSQYRPTKIPLTSVRPFEYSEVGSFCRFIIAGAFFYVSDFLVQVVLKDEPDIDANDQNSILEHLDKVVSQLIVFLFKEFFYFIVLFLIFFIKNIPSMFFEGNLIQALLCCDDK